MGDNAAGELEVADWLDVVAVAAGNASAATNTGRSRTVGLRSDGTAVATGANADHQCEVDTWTAIQLAGRASASRRDGSLIRDQGARRW